MDVPCDSGNRSNRGRDMQRDSRMRRLIRARMPPLLALRRCCRRVARRRSKVQVGLMLPYTGTFAQLGVAIENGLRWRSTRRAASSAAARSSASRWTTNPSRPRRTENANRLVKRDKVDVLDRHRALGRAMGMAKVAREATRAAADPERRRRRGTGAAVRAQRVPHLVLQLAAGARAGQGDGRAGHKTRRVHHLEVRGRRRVVRRLQGRLRQAAAAPSSRSCALPFPNVEFQALLTEIASLRPDAVACFFAGGGAVKFVSDYAAAGLKDKIPLYGSGFLTEGVLEAQGAAADGIMTTLHYADSLDTPRNNAFRAAYEKAYNVAAGRLRGAGLRHRPAARCRASRRSRATSATRGAVQGDGGRGDRQPARQVDACRRRTTRCRTSTCARSRTRRTR